MNRITYEEYKKEQEKLAAENKTANEKKYLACSVVSGKVGRNKPCPCGSGKKHKKCCGQ